MVVHKSIIEAFFGFILTMNIRFFVAVSVVPSFNLYLFFAASVLSWQL